MTTKSEIWPSKKKQKKKCEQHNKILWGNNFTVVVTHMCTLIFHPQ